MKSDSFGPMSTSERLVVKPALFCLVCYTSTMSTEPASISENNPGTCSVCHQPVLKEYYFCPNCGNKLHIPPLSISDWTQIGIYAFSIILPSICFILVTKWPGIKYIKSHDSKSKKIGIIALILLIVSTVVTYWLAVTWTIKTIQSAVDTTNITLSGYSL